MLFFSLVHQVVYPTVHLRVVSHANGRHSTSWTWEVYVLQIVAVKESESQGAHAFANK